MPLRTVSNTGGNWNATTTWVGGVVPIAGDTVDFTPTSGNLTVNVSTANLVGIDFTNYTATITFNNLLNTSGTVNLGTGGFTIAGANFLNINGTATLSGTTQWSGNLRFNGQNITITLLNDITSTGTVRFSSTNSTLANPLVINGFNINIKGNFDVVATANGLTTGTTVLQVNGTSGTSTIAGSVNLFFGLSIVINSTNNINMSTHMLFRDATFTYITSNSITWPTTRFVINSATMNVATTIPSLEIQTSTITFTNNLVCYDLFIVGAPTFVTGGFLLNVINDLRLQDVTLSIPNDLYVTNLITVIRPTQSVINGFTIYVSGNLINGCQFTLFGTTAIVLTGTGTWIHNHPTGTGSLQNNLTINTTGTITISGLIRYNTGTLTYTSGAVITDGSTLVVPNTTTLNTNGITWNNVSFNNGATYTITLSSDLYISGTLNVGLNSSSSITINSNNIYLSGSLIRTGLSVVAGTTVINIIGSGTWTDAATTGGSLRNNIVFNTFGIFSIIGTVYYNTGTLTYIRGTIRTKGSTLFIALSTSFINVHRINFSNIIAPSNNTLTMNEFFSGSPINKTRISSNGVNNYAISFTDTKKKISKYIRISNATINTRGQLRVIGDSSCNRGNNLGIIFEPNQTPNGVSLNNGITANLSDGLTFGTSGLLNDPVYN